jgi:hypothetical protein
MVARLDRITREAQHVASAEGPGSEEVGDEGDTVAVPTGELRDRLQTRGGDERGAGQRRHVRDRPRLVRHVHRIRDPDEGARLVGHP